MNRPLAALTSSCVLLACSVSAAEEPFDVTWPVDVPVALAAIALGGSMQLLKDELVVDRCAPRCVEARVNALDRTTLGHYSLSAAHAGNVLVGVNLALPHLFGAIDTLAGDHPAASWGRDTMILAETGAVSVLLQQIAAFSTRRPRPYAYNTRLDPALLGDANSYLSFYSGHTANSFAMASAFSYIFTVRHPASRWAPAVWTLTHGLAALEGYSRVASGYHFWSDVLVGALVGSTIGLVVPWLHRDLPSRRAWYVAPLVSGDGAGAALAWHQ